MQMVIVDKSLDDELTVILAESTISEILQKFTVSTQRTKLKIPPKPDHNELIPLSLLKIQSLAKKGKIKLEKRMPMLTDNVEKSVTQSHSYI